MVPRTVKDGVQAVIGERFVGVQRVPHRNAAGRVCAERGCDTLLSVYNDGKFCAAHAPLVVPILRGMKDRRARTSSPARKGLRAAATRSPSAS